MAFIVKIVAINYLILYSKLKCIVEITSFKNKKAFQSKANCPLAGRCIGNIVNKFEQVWGQGWGLHVDRVGGSQVNWGGGAFDLCQTNDITGSGHMGTPSPVNRQTQLKTLLCIKITANVKVSNW